MKDHNINLWVLVQTCSNKITIFPVYKPILHKTELDIKPYWLCEKLTAYMTAACEVAILWESFTTN
jgi:hypothetical protein